MSASQRNKGSKGEREFLRLLGERLCLDLRRNLQQTREGGADCLDVAGFMIEIKRQEKLSIGAWWAQAIRQATDSTPALAYRQSRHPWRIIVPISVMGSAYSGQPDGMTVEMGIDEFALVCRERLT